MAPKTHAAIYICGDGPGSYGYDGHDCNRKGCGHYRIDHRVIPDDEPGAITGACSKARCRCPAFENLP
jgi:hypothetical protein